ncbi:hypothetical protein M9194_03655 [Vibrio sp. S4M6]|uniref:hypothetical protein n=1 Tax=Vibrio sinus TaxID=2946865 RepID=UPI00202AAE78|nr:hypothetical protein [Vibrio sinus]MCL9780529.1 hypothetical protein [Vibrio sinus]
MSSKDDYIYSTRHFKLALWLFIVMILIASFFSYWQSIDSQINATSVVIAKKLIIDRASFYRQEWLLKSKPTSILVNGEVLHFSQHGWLLPISDDGSSNCMIWIELLSPESVSEKGSAVKLSESDFDDQYFCQYQSLNNESVTIQLRGESFEVF